MNQIPLKLEMHSSEMIRMGRSNGQKRVTNKTNTFDFLVTQGKQLLHKCGKVGQ